MIIVDASVINKLFLLEENREQAQAILDQHLKKLSKIVVPELLLYEVANTLATKTDISLSRIKSNLKDLQDADLQIEHITFDMVSKAVAFAKKYQVTVYDATYAVLAKEKKCILITADKKFVSQLNLPFVKSLDQF